MKHVYVNVNNFHALTKRKSNIIFIFFIKNVIPKLKLLHIRTAITKMQQINDYCFGTIKYLRLNYYYTKYNILLRGLLFIIVLILILLCGIKKRKHKKLN